MQASKYLLWGAVSFVAVTYTACEFEKEGRFTGMLPAEIHTNRLIYIHDSWLFSGNCDGGVAVFELSEETASEIERDGIRFFDRANSPRKMGHYEITYAPWRATPLPGNWTSVDVPRMTWAGLDCSAGAAEIKKVISAAWSNGGYFAVASRGGARLVVLPEMRRIVVSYSTI